MLQKKATKKGWQEDHINTKSYALRCREREREREEEATCNISREKQQGYDNKGGTEDEQYVKNSAPQLRQKKVSSSNAWGLQQIATIQQAQSSTTLTLTAGLCVDLHGAIRNFHGNFRAIASVIAVV